MNCTLTNAATMHSQNFDKNENIKKKKKKDEQDWKQEEQGKSQRSMS